MGSGEVAIVALSTMISLKVTFSDGLGGRVLNEAYLRCTYLQGRTHVLAGTVARTCKDRC